MNALVFALLLAAHHPAHGHGRSHARPKASKVAAPAPELGVSLQKVETSTPLRLQAPAGWSVEIEAPRREALSTIAVLRPDCPGGPDTSVTVQLDQTAHSPAQLLKLRYPRSKSQRLRGWDCVLDTAAGEAMCAGTTRGLRGVVAATFFSADPSAFRSLGGADLAAAVASGLSWKGGAASRLATWRRDATELAMCER